ncbi:MAG: hypothetical protein J6S67_02265 [Methanobrevibacter sp.]|nr:hypothetical protein [Methanobrevibacter sp.]
MVKKKTKSSLLDRIKLNYKKYIMYAIVLIVAILSGAGIDVVVRPNENGDMVVETSFSLHLSSKQKPALVDTAEGEIEVTDIVTVESVDGNQLFIECPVDEPECGLGRYIYAPVDTPTAFKDYTLGGCWNTDGVYGAQCWDLADMFWQNYAGRNFSTCGTHKAKGSWECKEYNAGNEFSLITDKTKLQTGDWIIFGSGEYGHVGMSVGSYNNGYIALLGQNQGGSPCDGGGSSANIINISLNSFVGAFRPKSYEKPEPEPTPIPVSGCVLWHVKRGDTMSKIMMECEGTIQYGEVMNEYAKTWYSLIVKPNQSVYDGWNSPSGVGLYAGDDIEHRF